MAGAGEPYDYLPFFYSDLFDLGYEAVGELDSRLEMVIDGDELGGQMTVYYVDDERRPRGVLLWNLFGQVRRRERADPRRQARDPGRARGPRRMSSRHATRSTTGRLEARRESPRPSEPPRRRDRGDP